MIHPANCSARFARCCGEGAIFDYVIERMRSSGGGVDGFGVGYRYVFFVLHVSRLHVNLV